MGDAADNPNALWERLAEVHKETIVRPPNSFTTIEYARKMGLTRNKAAHNLHVMLDLGRVKKHKSAQGHLVFWTLT